VKEKIMNAQPEVHEARNHFRGVKLFISSSTTVLLPDDEKALD
jgi:hypothetical protein